MSFRRVEAGTEVTYAAEFTFSGPARFVAPLLRPPSNGWASKQRLACTGR
jgi:hypothetical protein